MAKRKTIGMIFAGCAGLSILMIGSCASLVYFGYRNADSAVSPKIEAMFYAIENDSFADTYETETAKGLRETVSKEQYTALGDGLGVRLGKLQSKSLRSFKMRQSNADSYMDASYEATFEKGKGTINASLKKEGNDWKFMEFRVNSPVFKQDMATAQCPACGEPHTANARFCPSCGASVSTADNGRASQDEMQSPDAPETER